MLGGPKNDKNQKHANHGDNTGIRFAVGHKDLSGGFNKNQYRIGN